MARLASPLVWVKQNALILSLLGAVVVATFLPVLAGRFYGTGDMRDVFIPLETFFQQEQRSGRLPTWDPNVAWGFPVLAAAQLGFYYPPLLLLRWLPIWFYFPVVLIGHFFALALGMYIWLRQEAYSKSASFLGSLIFTLSAFGLQHLTHFNIVLAIAWLPWQLLVASRLARHKTLSHRDIALAGLVLGIPFLIGQIQIPLFLLLFTAVFFMYRWYQHSPAQQPVFGKWALIALVIGGIAAAQLLPTFELARLSSRGAGGDFDIERANQHSFPLYHLPTLLFPRFYGADDTYWGKRLEIEYGFFIGTFPLLLALGGLWHSVRHRRYFWPGVTLIAFLLALGHLSPFRLLWLEPSLWFFSAPARWLLFTTLGLAVLAAHGWEQLGVNYRPTARLVQWAGASVATLVVLANLLLFVYPDQIKNLAISQLPTLPITLAYEPSYYRLKIEQLITSAQQSSVSLTAWPTYLPLVVLAAVPWLIRSTRGQWVLLGLSVLELGVFASTASPLIPWSRLLTPPASIAKLPPEIQQGEARLVSVRESGDRGAIFTDPASRPNPAVREEQRQLLVPLVYAQFDLAGVEWPASLDLQDHEAALQQLRASGNYTIANEELARELNIGAVLALDDTGQVTISALTAKPRVELLTAASQPMTNATLAYDYPTPQSVRIITTTRQPGVVVLRDTWLPGWEAAVDERPAVIAKREPFFRAINIPAGTHTVTMHYRPLSVRLGLYISVSTILVALLLLLRRPQTA
jgi:hypothetical protein